MSAVISMPMFAGNGWLVQCKNKKCFFHSNDNFKTLVALPIRSGIMCDTGGGFNFVQVQGYCKTCNKFRVIRWSRESPEKAPKSFGKTVDKILKQERNIYECPKCHNLFIEIESFMNLKKCPICYTSNFKAILLTEYD